MYPPLPFSYEHAAERVRTMKVNAERYGIPLYLVNHVGAQTEVLFDGGSVVINQKGRGDRRDALLRREHADL